jgi:hypothetical protein
MAVKELTRAAAWKQVIISLIVILFSGGLYVFVGRGSLIETPCQAILGYDGVLVIRALLRVITKIPIHEIVRISFPAGRFVAMSWTNWEEISGGDILIQHGSTETRINRFPHDEDFVMELLRRNPAIEVVRTPPIPGD